MPPQQQKSDVLSRVRSFFNDFKGQVYESADRLAAAAQSAFSQDTSRRAYGPVLGPHFQEPSGGILTSPAIEGEKEYEAMIARTAPEELSAVPRFFEGIRRLKEQGTAGWARQRVTPGLSDLGRTAGDVLYGAADLFMPESGIESALNFIPSPMGKKGFIEPGERIAKAAMRAHGVTKTVLKESLEPMLRGEAYTPFLYKWAMRFADPTTGRPIGEERALELITEHAKSTWGLSDEAAQEIAQRVKRGERVIFGDIEESMKSNKEIADVLWHELGHSVPLELPFEEASQLYKTRPKQGLRLWMQATEGTTKPTLLSNAEEIKAEALNRVLKEKHTGQPMADRSEEIRAVAESFAARSPHPAVRELAGGPKPTAKTGLAEVEKRIRELETEGGGKVRIVEPQTTEPAKLRLFNRAVHPYETKLIEKWGVADEPVEGASFLLSDGRFVNIGAIEHPSAISMIQGTGPLGSPSRTAFIKETGVIRARIRSGRAGKEFVASIPEEGITGAQAESIRRMAGRLRTGRIVIEVGHVGGGSVSIDFPTVGKIDDALAELVPRLTSRAGKKLSWWEKAAAAARESGGATVNPKTGELITKGHAVEMIPERRRVLDHDVTPEDIRQFYRDNIDVFRKYPELHVGLGGRELNVSGTGERAAAEYIGKRLDQQSVANLEAIPRTGKAPDEAFISTGGTGKGTRFPSYSIEKRLEHLRTPDYSPRFKEEVLPHLSEPEIRGLAGPEGRKTQEAILALHDALPSREEFIAAAKAGRVAEGWWERSGEAVDHLFGEDARLFKGVMSALSPHQRVRNNLLMSIRSMAAWVRAGRPKDVRSIERVMDTIPGAGKEFAARFQNAVRALSGEELSGPKVGSMARSLQGDLSQVVFDTWMSIFSDVKQSAFGGHRVVRGEKVSGNRMYLAVSAKMRDAAKELGLQPAQAQEQIWAFTKTLAEMMEEKHTAQEVLPLMSESDIVRRASDFAEMLRHDTEIGEALKSLGIDISDPRLQGRLDEIIARRPTPRPGQVAGAHSDVLKGIARRFDIQAGRIAERKALEAAPLEPFRLQNKAARLASRRK